MAHRAFGAGAGQHINQCYCTNCGEGGHSTKQCLHPITSHGVIVFRIRDGWNPTPSVVDGSINGMDATHWPKVDFLLIQRKDSLGFVDIMRGKYKSCDYSYIKTQLRGMTRDEQHRLLTLPFDTLWEQLWGPPADGSNPYRHEKEVSRQKLELLRTGTPSLAELIASVGSVWTTPEWGFPKGRRDAHETEFVCAMRELWEETGLTEQDVIPIRNLQPIKETFFGSNGVQYCHKYFVMYMPKEKEVRIDPTNECMRREIGDLAWCTMEEAMARIRPENVEKRDVLLNVNRLLRNYCALQIRN